MHSLGDIAKALNRPTVYLVGLQERFGLPKFDSDGYSEAYLAFLRNVVYLRILNVTEESLLELWQFEMKLLQLLHADSTGSPTWFLDSCGQTSRQKQRLLLSNYDLGVALPSGTLQLGLDFSPSLPELFEGKEMGEDALRVLRDYLTWYSKIKIRINAELPNVREATSWSKRFRY